MVHADETSWRLNSVWAFLSEKARVLVFGCRKDGETLAQLLPKDSFAGILVSDDAALYAYFFYIMSITSKELSVEQIVGASNQRCDQENIISQLKQMGALSASLHSLTSNCAYMVMATLAWNLKAWLALSLTESGAAKLC